MKNKYDTILSDLMTIRQLQEYLQCGTNTVYTLVKDGEFPSVMFAGKWYINKKQLIIWMQTKCVSNKLLLSDLPTLMTVRDIAQCMICSKEYIYDVIKSKGFPSIKIGGRWYVLKEPFFEWLKCRGRGVA